MPLSELRKPENIAAIKAKYAERIERSKRLRVNRKLVETLGGLDQADEPPKACLICQL
jgi:hypothetical protein